MTETWITLTELKDIQEAEFNILLYFDNLCRREGLTYYLAGGTQLGAVRHGGFIPWDDDIDVAMPRPDYDRLMELDELKKGRYLLINHKNRPKFHNLFSKICDTNTKIEEKEREEIEGYGLFIDIFPIDGLGRNEKRAKRLGRRIWNLRCAARDVDFPELIQDNRKRRMLRPLFALIGFERLVAKAEKLSTRYEFRASEWRGSILGGAKAVREILPGYVYAENEDIVFEGRVLKGMKHYDEYLKAMYGDYMKLPPEDKRVWGHMLNVQVKKNT